MTPNEKELVAALEEEKEAKKRAQYFKDMGVKDLSLEE